MKHSALSRAGPQRMQVIKGGGGGANKNPQNFNSLFHASGQRSTSTQCAELHSSFRWSSAQNQPKRPWYSMIEYVLLSPFLEKAQGCTMQTLAHPYQGRARSNQFKLGMRELKITLVQCIYSFKYCRKHKSQELCYHKWQQVSSNNLLLPLVWKLIFQNQGTLLLPHQYSLDPDL